MTEKEDISNIDSIRLYEDEKNALMEILKEISGEVYFFGSRVDKNRKGGDIDILIFSRENSFKLAQRISSEFFLKTNSKLDVLALNRDKITKEQKIFLDTLNVVRIK